MKRKFFGLAVAVVLLGGVVSANAAFFNPVAGVLYDTIGDVYWRQNILEFNNQTYGQQLDSIDDLLYGGTIGQWRMANNSEIQQLISNYDIASITNAFLASTPSSVQGRVDTFIDTFQHYSYTVANGIEVGGVFVSTGTMGLALDTLVSSSLGAWVIANNIPESTAPVPEPATMILFGTGLAGLAAARRRKKVC